MPEKTIAIKLLEGKKILHQVYEYPAGERDAERVAAEMAVPAGQVFKTLVVLRPAGKPMLVMVPADRQLDLKKLAQAVGEKKVKMATHKEAEALTGLQVGGISALALLNRGFAVYLDRSAQAFPEIYVSAGRRGLDIRLAVADLIRLTGARVVDVS
ncbi:MAG: aminoacyl-tRNA deacylase [Chloroflexi bacterium]|nr:aminoacyl-tRNA deacylase [Chloroflexota bacterium]MCI0580751.1 aminoacyl-tRNA deacylase [Chloroflexota bacterium]MCI0644614.1 aminoacyl-tRNA deacylase [Chloroflexota bacterium]MCI0727619.1 aminoacyl-tRNA deacylase [Chloroflexota bacterium]